MSPSAVLAALCAIILRCSAPALSSPTTAHGVGARRPDDTHRNACDPSRLRAARPFPADAGLLVGAGGALVSGDSPSAWDVYKRVVGRWAVHRRLWCVKGFVVVKSWRLPRSALTRRARPVRFRVVDASSAPARRPCGTRARRSRGVPLMTRASPHSSREENQSLAEGRSAPRWRDGACLRQCGARGTDTAVTVDTYRTIPPPSCGLPPNGSACDALGRTPCPRSVRSARYARRTLSPDLLPGRPMVVGRSKPAGSMVAPAAIFPSAQPNGLPPARPVQTAQCVARLPARLRSLRSPLARPCGSARRRHRRRMPLRAPSPLMRRSLCEPGASCARIATR
jgi:hypothetical protein